MTQLESAVKKTITPLVKQIAALEGIQAKEISELIACGKIVIPCNKNHTLKKPCGIGYKLTTKINANIGTSPDKTDLKLELKKLAVSLKYGADAVMDLSVAGNIAQIRNKIRAASPVPLGTVPVYEIAVNAQRKKGDFLEFSGSDMLEVLEKQAKEGVDFFTIHSGVTQESLSKLKTKKRIMGIVSRGGAIIASWMSRHKKENPFYEYFDEILDIAYKHDVTLSLGDGLRPGSILDATDQAQISELAILGKLAVRAKKKFVQVMIEGPGHVPLQQIKENILLEKKLCHGAPFYVLGPLVTDIAAGYDHITAAIGGAIAASHGADFLCYVTPAEHLRLPSLEDVRVGVIASKIAAHAADIAKGIPQAIRKDTLMSLARQKRDWKRQIALSIDPDKAYEYRASSKPLLSDVCTMCGNYCSIKLMEQCNHDKKTRV
ncbi:MAG: phosphomethylpyrimidine synthase ThiC [Candidatus Omnitrophota bacterium]|jgi:phosphomethylpyrimidine synthase